MMNGIWLARRLLVSWKKGREGELEGSHPRSVVAERSLGVLQARVVASLYPGGPAHLTLVSRVKTRGGSVRVAQFQCPGTYSLGH